MDDYDFLVFIGRFQPFHKGHAKIVSEALVRTKKLILLIGSVNQPRTIKNPFNYFERTEIIKKSLPYLEDRILFRPLHDFNSDNEWVEEVKNQVNIALETSGTSQKESKVGLIGMNKDESTYYLQHFSFWPYVEIDKPDNVISATEIRNWYFNNEKIEINDYLYHGAFDFLDKFKNTQDYKLIKERENND